MGGGEVINSGKGGWGSKFAKICRGSSELIRLGGLRKW